MKRGYWASHRYERRAVEREIRKLGGFVGWRKIVVLNRKLEGSKSKRNQALYAAAFLTGGRIGEVLLLKSGNFEVDADEVVVKRMPLFKRYEKLGEYTEWVDEKPENKLARLFKLDEEKGKFYRKRFETSREEEYRTNFSFPTNEPLASLLIEWLQTAEGYLFPGYNEHLSYIRAYQIIAGIGIHPHWLRAQRASCLISYYGLKMEEMMEWMGWEELSTARMYAMFGRKTLTAKMRGKQYPV